MRSGANKVFRHKLMANAVSSFSVPNGPASARAPNPCRSGTWPAVRQRKNHEGQRDAYTEKAPCQRTGHEAETRRQVTPYQHPLREAFPKSGEQRELAESRRKGVRIRQGHIRPQYGIGKKQRQDENKAAPKTPAIRRTVQTKPFHGFYLEANGPDPGNSTPKASQRQRRQRAKPPSVTQR